MRAVRRILLFTNALALLALWTVALAQNVPPQSHSLAAMACFALPFVLLFNLIMVVLWLVVRWKYAIGSVLGILLCTQSIYTYLPLFGRGRVDDAGEDVLKVMSFNTHSWGMLRANNDDGSNNIVNWVIGERPHVVLLQEANLSERYIDPFTDAGYTLLRPSTVKSACIITRLPVVDHETLDMPTLDHNGALSARLLWQGDTVRVVSVHFESFKLQDDDIGEYRNLVRSPMGDSASTQGRHIIGKMRPVLRQHGLQADTIAKYVEAELAAGRHVIVGGDFNDLPNSYACGRMRGLLTDCYRLGGSGLGFTYDDDFMHFRIDHIFCSSSFNTLGTIVADPPAGSDHKPVVTWLRLRQTASDEHQ